ncbi:aminopeptidase M1 [Tanacetum coccineum]
MGAVGKGHECVLMGRIETVDSNGHLMSCHSSSGGVDRGRGIRRYDRLARARRIRMGSWNVGSLTRKIFELGHALGRHKVDIACFQETKWKGSRAREGNGYKLWYSGSSTARNDVGIMLAGRLKDNVVRVTRRSDRTMAISVIIEGETVNVISAYAPQVGLSEAEKKRFWDALDELVRDYPTDQRLIIGGDLNGHIGASAEGYTGIHGGFGFGDRNEEGCTILEFATAHDLIIANSFFKKSDAHLITFQSGGHKSQIDYLLVRRGDLRACKDCRAFPGEACASQHRLVTVDVFFKTQRHRRELTGRRRILWKNLKGEAVETFRASVTEKLAAFEEDMRASNADQMWNTLACAIKDAAKDSLGVARESDRTHSTLRESWWFCEEVQTKVATKLSRFKELLSCQEGNQEDIDMAKERYKVAKREAKIAVARAKDKAYEDLYKRLDSREGANDIYKIAKARERRRRDIGNVRFIKDEGGRTIVREDDIKKRWGEYFSTLFNETLSEDHLPEGGREVGSTSPHTHFDFDCYYSRINQGEVRAALQKMGRNKAIGPDQIPIEAWKCLEDEGVKWLTRLFNKIFPSAKMPDEWRLSEVIPIYKNKGDAQTCSNYRGIKLLSHTMKLWERVIERRVRRETRVSENQFGFMPGRSTTEAIHLLRSLMEKYRERQRDLHMVFLDMEKAYDSVSRQLVWKTLIDKGTPRRYLKVIQDMYEGAKTRVRTTVGNTDFFPVEVGLHQGSAISPYLFTLILDEISRGIQENIPWCMIFADDIMLIAESAEELNNRLESWRKELEDNGLQAASGVLCDRRIPLKLKGKFYRVAIRPTMLYGLKCWPITKAQANKVEVAELRMRRWTSGKTMVDMIPNEVFRVELGVDSIIDKMREGRLRWFGYVKRRLQTALVRRVEAMLVEGSRRRGRPKLRWEDRIKLDMKELLLSEDMTSDRNEWRDRIRISG